MTTRSFNLTPVPKNIPNVFDYFGMILGLMRIRGEKNAEYRKRLWDVYVRRAGSNEEGLLNGITRELGLKFYDALTITYTGPNTNSPRVIVQDVQIELYSNWNLIDDSISPNTEDGDPIDIYSKTSDGYYIGGLIDEINSSTYFTAAIANGVAEKAPSASLLTCDSRQWQDSESLKPFHRNILANNSIVPGTVTFSADYSHTFLYQKDTEGELAIDGDYYIDYTNGVIVSHKPPSIYTTCRYMYDELPLTLQASPVVLHEFDSSAFRSKIFEQILQPDGTYTDGLPMNVAIGYINELMAVKAMFWGS